MNIRKLIFASVILLLVLPLSSQTSSSSKSTKSKSTSSKKVMTSHDGVHMTFENEKIQLGKMKKGDIKNFQYVFTNTGTEIIEIDIATGCDCTTLDYPKNKILPGKKAIINVSFDSNKKHDDESNTAVDVYLKNLNPKTGQRILKILNFSYDLY